MNVVDLLYNAHLVFEIAPTSRARCVLCHHPIEKGEVKAIAYYDYDHQWSAHIGCFVERNYHFINSLKLLEKCKISAKIKLKDIKESPKVVNWKIQLFWNDGNITELPSLPDDITKRIVTMVSEMEKEA